MERVLSRPGRRTGHLLACGNCKENHRIPKKLEWSEKMMILGILVVLIVKETKPLQMKSRHLKDGNEDHQFE
jgi:hypothetical protein